MDLDLHDIIDLLHSAARSVGAEVSSPWFYLQLGLVMVGAGIAFAAGAAGFGGAFGVAPANISAPPDPLIVSSAVPFAF